MPFTFRSCRTGNARLGESRLGWFVNQVSVTDGFSGSEAIAPMDVAVPISDSVVGADSVFVEGPVFISDTIVGSEQLSIEASIPITDAITGADAVSIEARLAVSDSMVGTDQAPGIEARVPVSDILTGTSTQSVEANVIVLDSLSLLERRIPVGDTRTARFRFGEAQLYGQPSFITEGVTVTTGVSDSIALTDAALGERFLTISDSFTGSDAVAFFNHIQQAELLSIVEQLVKVQESFVPPTHQGYFRQFRILFESDE